MRRRTQLFVIATAILAFAFVAAGVAAKQGGVPAIPLNPEQETADVDSAGSGFFSYTTSATELCYTLSVSDLTAAPIAAHIHPGPRNIAGPVAVPLATPPGATSSVTGCITADPSGAMTPAELAAIVADPGAFYVNVHTPLYPGGEVRGQLK
jgi:hypothetical protein